MTATATTNAAVPHAGSAAREPARGPMLEIANAMVRAYKDLIGRGPRKCRAHFAGADTLVVVLESTMTTSERNLAALGEHERLREHRLFLTSTSEERFRSTVEHLLRRRTRACISGFDTRRDIAVQIFTLEPDPADQNTTPAERPGSGRAAGDREDPPAAKRLTKPTWR